MAGHFLGGQHCAKKKKQVTTIILSKENMDPGQSRTLPKNGCLHQTQAQSQKKSDLAFRTWLSTTIKRKAESDGVDM